MQVERPHGGEHGEVWLQEGQKIIGDSHPHVVILFSDIVGFSEMATTMPAVEVFMLVRLCLFLLPPPEFVSAYVS